MLAATQRLELDPDPFGPDAGTLALTAWAASFDRDHHLADPDAMRIHPSTLLGDGHLAALCDAIRAGIEVPRGVSPPPGPDRAGGDTIGLVTADAEGRAVSLIQSLFSGFGAGILEPTTGIVAQNRGSGFTLDPEHPNVMAPGKRPAHTLTPVLVQRDGRFEAALGTMGGYAQPQIHAALVARAFMGAMSASEAVATPRWLVGGLDGLDRDGDACRDGHDNSNGNGPTVVVEGGVPEETRRAITEAGFTLEILDAERDESAGHAQMIRAMPDGFQAGSDPRADGAARAS
jgi:gamma-glutamyltranspeptidase/glutathione hydrolase